MPLRGRLKAQGSRIKVGRKKEAGGEISARFLCIPILSQLMSHRETILPVKNRFNFALQNRFTVFLFFPL